MRADYQTEDIDLVIHSGDLFHSPRPSCRALVAASQPLLSVAASGVPIVVVPGNHERSAIPSALLLSHANIHIVTAPCTLVFKLRGMRVAVSSFPCLRREAANKFPLALAATRWPGAKADLRILAVHQAFDSATCGPVGYRFRNGEDVVMRESIPPAFDYVAAEHVHRHQCLSSADPDVPPVVYAGSPDRVSFAEINEPKGCVIVSDDGDGLAHRFLEHDVRPMSVWPLDVSGISGSEIVEKTEGILASLPPSAIAQLRMTGCTTRGSLRGLGLTLLARQLRPDVLFTVSARAIELGSRRTVESRTQPYVSAFANLKAPETETLRAAPATLTTIPTECGVYALHDRSRRLLYVGKSKDVRARIRSHLRGGTGGNFFRGWAHQVAQIEVRITDSELEALLIEAELVRMLRPPFNRQMRRWTSYCYLCEDHQPFRQLAVHPQPKSGRRSFGPYRSRQQAEAVREAVASHFGLAMCPGEEPEVNPLPLLRESDAARLCDRFYQRECEGPCASSADRSAYDQRVRERDVLLLGIDESSLREFENRFESQPVQTWDDDTNEAALRRAAVLRAAFGHAAVLREAEELLHGLLILPGPSANRKTGSLTLRGIHFDVLRNKPVDAKWILDRHRTLSGRHHAASAGRLPKTVVDCLCIAARELRRDSRQYRFIHRDELVSLTERDLLTEAFSREASFAI